MSTDYVYIPNLILILHKGSHSLNVQQILHDEYCIYFGDDEENSIQQSSIYQQFQTEMAVVYDSFSLLQTQIILMNLQILQFSFQKDIKEILNSDGEETQYKLFIIIMKNLDNYNTNLLYHQVKPKDTRINFIITLSSLSQFINF